MFLSKCLVSKKGPLGAIWIAAYFFKKLKKAQIFETNISSSVDNILQDQLEILAYRVLAYLLLGVVRIYSKKVEYLFDDCQEVLVKIDEFVFREKNRAKKYALRATCFSITRPVSFDLDAFDLKILEDTSGDNVVPRQEITLKDVAWKNAGIRQYSLDRFAALDDDFLMDYTPTEDSLSFHLMDFETEARTSHDVCDLEASMEKLRYDKSFHEEVSHLKTVSGVEEEPSNLVKVFDKDDREHGEVPDMAGLENHMNREANRQKYNDRFSSEECVNPQSEAEEDPLGPVKPLAEDQSNRETMKGPDLSKSENEMHQAMEEDHVSILEASAEVPDIAGSENHMEREAIREKCNDRFFSEVVVNLHGEAEEEPLSPVKPLGENQAHREKMNSPDLLQSEKEVHQVMQEDCNLEASVEKLQAEGFSHMDLEEPSPLVRPLGEDIQTGAEQVNFPAMTTSKDQKCQVAGKDHPLSVTLDKTPQSMLRDASGATTPRFMLIPTPAAKERARFSRKRKCFFDDMIVFPNGIMRQWIKDASDLVSKRGKGGCTALAARKTRWNSNLSQSFSEPSIPCTSELKPLYCGKRLRLLESVKIMKPPEKTDTSEPPAVGGSAEIALGTVEFRGRPPKLNLSPLFDGSSVQAGIASQTPIRQSPSLVVGEQTEIAPQTPVLHSKSMRSFESPENLDEVGPQNVDPSQRIEKEPSLNEIVEKESSVNKDEDLDLNLEIHPNEDDNQGQGKNYSNCSFSLNFDLVSGFTLDCMCLLHMVFLPEFCHELQMDGQREPGKINTAFTTLTFDLSS
ncbi:hypothetical protein CRYUN_Cryun27aG0025300 [Craigia yunnanensis]